MTGALDEHISSGDDSEAQMFDAADEVQDEPTIDVEIVMHPYLHPGLTEI